MIPWLKRFKSINFNVGKSNFLKIPSNTIIKYDTSERWAL